MAAEITVRVVPRSSKNSVEVKNGQVRVCTTAPPVDGEANAAVIKSLSKFLGVGVRAISIIRGHTSRDKTIQIDGMDQAEAEFKLGLTSL